jgi:amino acid adenylation domain-containing protein
MDRKNVEDLYPLSPLQQGMLFSTLYAPGSGAYVEQTVLVLAGRPRAAELRRAWEMVVERHPVLRTGFVWEGVPKPMQVVFRKVELPFQTHDWSALPAEERDARWARFMADDRERGFDLLRAPLMRFALIRTAPDEHRLVWTSHHILTDGWSLPLVLNDFDAFYHGLLTGAPPRLRPVRPFREYVAWLNRQDAAAAERYWRGRLADLENPTPLPLDRAPARAGQPAADHALEQLLLPPAATAALDEAARRLRVTASAILQGAWAVVLARMSAADDVVFGTTVSGRPPELQGVQEMVGMFINTIPVRVWVDDDAPVGDWLRGIHREHAAAGEFEHAPLTEVQKWAGARADAGLFETLLVYENYPIAMGGGDGEDDGPEPEGALELVGMESTERTDLPLSLAVAPAPGGMRLSATCDPGRLHADDARRILAGLVEVLGQITGGAAARVADLSPFTDDERRRPLACWSGRVTPPVCDTIPSLFRAAAGASPDAVAVRAEDATLTYAQLDAASSRLARHLRARGVGMDGRVGVSMERSSRLVVALLAVVKAGAAYVPLDPSYPPERLDYMRRDSGTELVLVDGDAPAWAADARVVSLARDAAEIDARSDEDPAPACAPDALSYVLYTSGSTGTPKGVAVPHRAVVRLVRGADLACFGADETFLLLAPVAFDASTFEIWGALLNGGTLAVHPPEVPDPARLGAFLRDRGVTTLWLSAGLFHQVADADPAAFSGVRQVLAGGDTVSPAHVRRVLDACPGLRVIDGYGPTENTTFTACHTVRDEDLERGSIPVGRPVAGTQAYVLDARMRPVPAGVPGELYAGGQGLARGYLGRPAQTAQSFVPDPFSGVPGARLYRTGDRARWRDDGTLEFGGRLDQQVKIRGFRIEPGEIEAALRAHLHVGDAVVDARADGAAGRRLVAYVIPRDGVAPSAAEMRDALAGRLPAHMVPSAFVVLDALPLTPNGKVDRRALPEPEVEAGAGPAPRTPTEEVLAGLWSEVLGVDLPGRDDDFFHLGGHSLLATRLASRIRQAFAVEVPLRAVFEAPTLAAMAERVDVALRGEAGAGLPPVTAVGGNDLPLSFAQERLWFFDRLEPGNSVYNIPFALRLTGALDVDALQRSLGEIVRRHEALRTSFVEVQGVAVQRIHPPEEVPLPVDDLRDVAEGEAQAEVRRRVEAWTLLPYDLARDPLFRVRLLRLADDEHVLLGAMHHIVSDGWSMGVFWRELAVLYEAFVQGRPSPLAPLALQYGDVAVWQRRYLDGQAVQRQVEWWRARMEGAPALLELPTDRPRPPVQSYRGGLLPVQISAELAGRARALAHGAGATLFMAVLAAWSALLARWSGQDDVVVGTPIAGRTQRETEELIGLFVNTLPIRAGLEGDPSFRVLLGRVREATLGAYAHQDVPFDRLVEELRPGRSMSHALLYQVLLAFNNTTGGEAVELPGLRLEAVEEAGGVARVDLTLGFAPAPDGSLHGTLEYASDLFDAATAERMARHLDTLLAAALRQPDAPLASLPVMEPAELDAILAIGAATAVQPVDTTLHGWFARQAARTPDAPALTFLDETITYAQLDSRANRLAHRLRARGTGPGALVGLCVERSMASVAGVLGILKAGAAYLPLDPAYPDDRLAYMLEDSGAQLVVTSKDAAGRLPPGVELIRLDADESQVDTVDFHPIDVTPDAPAYVIYTSGSTGRPKGVQVTHANVARLMTATEPWFGFGAADVWTLFHSYAFDFSVWEIWGALLYGGRLVVVPFDVSRDPARFHALLRAEGVTVLNQTPSAFRQLIRVDGDAAVLPAPRGTSGEEQPELALRFVVFGGEALDPASLRPWVERRGADRPRLVNMYGITETTVHVTCRVITEDDVRAGSASPIGIPIPDLSVHLLDRRGAPVPIGIAGEMYVGGGGVARGYLGRPALTAQRFVPDPFAAEPGARLYRSGDLARRRADGSLEFVGRADDQVKVRGFRIEPGEIESALLQHLSVREAVVLARGEGDARRLVAWTVAADAVPAAELRAHLLARLPEYMVPSAFVPLDTLPLTRNGKVDRRALPDPDAAELSAAAYLPPRTPTEQVLAALWSGLLGVERVGAADEFFDLGGHSLLAMRVVAAVRESFGVELPVRAVFEHPALQALAAQVDRALRADGAVEAPPIVPVARDGDLPLSFAQERLWFVDRLEPGSPVYHMPLHYRLTGSLDTDALRRALAEVVRRHESLRTSLPFIGEQPAQRIAASVDVDLPVHDLRHLVEEAERDAAAEAVIGDVSNRAFDLERGPLFRAALVRMSDDEHLLVITLHHVIADGWSIGVLWSELSALYAAFVDGRPSPLPDLSIQYGDFAQWQRAWLTGDELERQLAYWRRRLAGAPPLLELPTDRPRPAVQTYVGAEAGIVLEGADAAAIRALGRREGSTLFMVLLAAMNVVFSRLAGQDDVVIGTPIAGRTRRETEGLIGLFLNSLALRTDLSGEPTFRQLLRRVREATLEAYAHQDLPFERILEELAPERSLSHSPLFQVMLNLANFGEGDVSLPGVEVEGVVTDAGLASKFDLTVYAAEGPDALGLYLVYNTALFDAERAQLMLAQLVGVLRQAAEDAERPIHRLSLLAGDARAALPDPTQPLAPEPWRGGVAQMFAARAAETPHALAVQDAEARWTYAELDLDANRIAHRLAADGVRPGDVVAVWAHRSAALPRALLAAWKAGSAFVVLDPAYPAARLAEYVRIARPAGVLRLAAAGEPPAEVAQALAETVHSTLVLHVGVVDKVAESADSPSHPPDVDVGPDDLAYLAFTSGTTGAPKAISGTHRPLAHFFGWYAAEFGLEAADRFTLLSGLAHDPLLRDLFAPLTAGAAVVVPDGEEIGTPGYLADWMRAESVTVAHLTPAMGALLTRHAEGGPLAALRLAAFGSDRLGAQEVDAIRALAPAVEVVNFYGATETPQVMAFHRVPAAPDAGAQPVGRGIEGAQLLVVTPAGALAAPGELGEICIRTPYLSRGYPNDPELTAARFIPNPFSGDAADRVYRTGDLGRYRPDGVVQPAGRADDQVKVRGFRVEPGEIEAVLRDHPAVWQAAVVARGEGDARRLVAYVVGDDGATTDALRAHLRGRLAEYMVPAAFVRLDAIPLTPNRKLDRRALPDPDVSRDDAAARPLSPTEALLAQVWGELLRREPGPADDFFALGGHSLLATRLSARVRKAFGVELPLRAVFEHPTLAALAADVERRMAGGGVADAPPLVPQPRGDTAPASYAQERMWFVDRLDAGSTVYHMPSAHRFEGAMDVDALRRALDALVERHESLRTVLVEGDDGLPHQRILLPAPVDLPLHDLLDLPSDEARGAELERLADVHAAQPFVLDAGPLFRAALVRLAADDHVLLVDVHHAVSDGWSNRILLRELAALYHAFVRGEPSPLLELPIQYADFAIWQRRWLAGEGLARQAAWWGRALSGAPPLLRLPTDRPRPAVQTYRGASEEAVLPPELAESARALGRREGATTFMVLLAAFSAVLGRWAGQDDVVVGTPVAGRTRAETEGVIGLFLNALALRTDLSGAPPFRALLGRVREATLGAFAHQDVPFERVLEQAQPERSLAHTPLFQVMLNLLNFESGDDEPGGSVAADGMAVSSLGAATQLAAKFDLTLYAAERADGLALHLVYNADLFDAPRMRALLSQLHAVLAQAVADPERSIGELSLRAEDAALPAADAPMTVRTASGLPAGIGEAGELWSRAADGAPRPAGARARYRPDGSIEVVPPDSPPAVTEAPPAAPVRAPSSATERELAGIWGEVLGIDAAGVPAGADFFALGGHSLRATQVLSRIRARWGVRLSIRAFFAAPTVAALASAIDAQAPPASTEPVASTETAVPTERWTGAPEPAESPLSHSRTFALSHFPPGVYPLSFAQQRMWVLMQLGSTAAYHLASALRMTGPLDAWALERALDEIVRRHETLRTRIQVQDGEPVQVVQPPRPSRLRAEDVRPADGESMDDALRRMAEEEAARPFPAEGPFLRVRLLRAGDDDHVLLWTLHHLVADGWSMGIFRNELLALYQAFATEADSPLVPLPLQYGDHALSQRRALSGDALDRLVGWWTERLSGAPALLELPTDRPRPAEPSGAGASFWFDFPAGTAERVSVVARAGGATPFMVLLAAFQALLARWSGQDDVVVGTPIANRTRPELEPLIGFFANTLALRGDLSGDPDFGALLARVREQTLGAYEHQDVPFERLVEALNPERSLGHAPVFQVMFALQNAPRSQGGSELEGLALSGLPRERETAQFDLALEVHELGDGLAARLEYATELFEPASMEWFAEQFVRLLNAALDDPSRPVAALPLMDAAERARLLEAAPGPAAPYPDAPLHDLFSAQARRTPDAAALVWDEGRMTYAELDAHAAAVARRLVAAGVRPGGAVAVLAEHSPHAVVALLGVLMAGGAFLPLDPASPADRLAFTLDDARAAAVLAQPHLAHRLPPTALPVVPLGAAEPAGAKPAVALPAVDPELPAWILYTSGSTGRPKGVAVAHAAAAVHLASCAEAYGLTADDRFLAFAALTFDPWLEQVLAPLCAGASVALRGPEVWTPAQLAGAVRRLGITFLDLPTAYWHHLVDDAPSAEAVKRAARLVTAGGEAMRSGAAARWAAMPGDAPLLNGYGPTEAVVGATAWEVDAAVAATAAHLPIGTPLPGRGGAGGGGGGGPRPPPPTTLAVCGRVRYRERDPRFLAHRPGLDTEAYAVGLDGGGVSRPTKRNLRAFCPPHINGG